MGVVGVAQRPFRRDLGLQAVAVVIRAVVGGAALVGHGKPLSGLRVGKADLLLLVQRRIGNSRKHTVQQVVVVGGLLAVKVGLRLQAPERIVLVSLNLLERQGSLASAVQSVVLE